MSSYIIGLLIFGMALAIIIPFGLTLPVTRRSIVVLAGYLKSLSIFCIISFARFSGHALTKRNYSRTLDDLAEADTADFSSETPKYSHHTTSKDSFPRISRVKFNSRQKASRATRGYSTVHAVGDVLQPAYSVDASGEYCEIPDTAQVFKEQRHNVPVDVNDNSLDFYTGGDILFSTSPGQSHTGEIFHISTSEDTIKIPEVEIDSVTDIIFSSDNEEKSSIVEPLSDAETEMIFMASDVQVEAELHYSFDMDAETLIPAETVAAELKENDEMKEIPDAIIALSMDERYHTDELILDQELAALPVINLSNYSANPRPVTHIPELEVLEPVFFGSPLLIETESLHHSTNIVDVKVSEEHDTNDMDQKLTSPKIHAKADADFVLDDEDYRNYTNSLEKKLSNGIESIKVDQIDNQVFTEDDSSDEYSAIEEETTATRIEFSHEKAQRNSSLDEMYDWHTPEHISRQHRGGFDPEIDSKIHAAKYRVRQRNLAIVAFIAILGICSSFLVDDIADAKILYLVLGLSLCPLIGYLLYLRHTVRLEKKIRSQRNYRYQRNQRSRNMPYNNGHDSYSNLVVVEIDDEDPIFDHLEMHHGLATSENTETSYRAAQAV